MRAPTRLRLDGTVGGVASPQQGQLRLSSRPGILGKPGAIGGQGYEQGYEQGCRLD